MITAIITGILLKGQREAEKEKERNAEIFKEKLTTYQKFLDALCEYVEQKASDRSKDRLKFRTAALAMHGNPQNLAKINNTIGEIMKMYGSEIHDEMLVPKLFEIARMFRCELYAECYENDFSTLEQSIEALNFTIRVECEEKSDTAMTDADDAIDDDVAECDIETWNHVRNRLTSDGWFMEEKPDRIRIYREDQPGLIEFKLRRGYYVVAASLNEDRDFARQLKDSCKGSRSGFDWWRELNTLRNYRVRTGQIVDAAHNNDKARALIVKWIDKLTEYINQYQNS